MDNKGTGWVPDFPDVKDYTLKSKQIQALTSHVQTDRLTGSIEDLTEQVSQALKLLTPQSSDYEKLKILIEKLDKKAAGGIYFAPTKIPKILKPGMSDPEILKVKKCLKSIYPEVNELKKDSYALDPTFDELTKELVEYFKETKDLPRDGIVDDKTINALYRLSLYKDKDKYEDKYEDKDKDKYEGKYEDKRIENILTPIPDQLFESVFKGIISNQVFEGSVMLMNPVNPSVFNVIKLALEHDPNKHKSAHKKLKDASDRLKAQIVVLGICSETDNLDGHLGMDLEVQEALTKIIIRFNEKSGNKSDNDISDISKISDIRDIYDDFVCEQLMSAVRQKINQLIYPIVKAVLQIIMPLGQHGDLGRAIEQGLEIFNSLIRKATTQEGKNEGLEAIQAKTTEKTNVLKKIETVDEAAHQKSICLAAIGEVAKMLPKEPPESEVRKAIDKTISMLVANRLIEPI